MSVITAEPVGVEVTAEAECDAPAKSLQARQGKKGTISTEDTGK